MPKGIAKNGVNRGWFRIGRLISPEEHLRLKSLVPWNKGKKGMSSHSKEWREAHRLRMLGSGNPMFGKKLPSGVDHHLYKKDRSLLKKHPNKMFDSAYMSWVREVKKRDGWKCLMKDVNCKGRLEAHHIMPWIKYPELRYEVGNGITLCSFHHPRKHKEVIELSKLFFTLIKVNV